MNNNFCFVLVFVVFVVSIVVLSIFCSAFSFENFSIVFLIFVFLFLFLFSIFIVVGYNNVVCVSFKLFILVKANVSSVIDFFSNFVVVVVVGVVENNEIVSVKTLNEENFFVKSSFSLFIFESFLFNFVCCVNIILVTF